MTEAPAPRSRTSAAPLYVDLDGTLLASDMLWESLLALVSRDPREALRLPGALRGGKAAFKRWIADRVEVDPDGLPYREAVLDRLRDEHARGRRLVLATATDAQLAEPIAEHLGLFSGVLASDGVTNLSGAAKRDAIARDADGAGYDYLGDGHVDLPIWEGAGRAMLAAAPPSVAAQAASRGLEVETLLPRPPRAAAAVKALRPRQWVKNALLFAPLVLAHEVTDGWRVLATSLAFVCFCAVASGTYLLNDLLDLADDRRHPRKRSRPFAAGTLPIADGVRILVAAFGLGLVGAAALVSLPFAGMLALYAATTVAYSTVFKRWMLVDVFVLAGLYTQRVLAGGVAAEVVVSPWLLAFCLFFFLSLALVKRYAELLAARGEGRLRLGRRDYEVADLSLVETMGLTSGALSVLVLCLFVTSDSVRTLYATPGLLWGIAPIMFYWVARVWFLARRGELSDDPVLFATRDATSWFCGAAVLGVVAWAAL